MTTDQKGSENPREQLAREAAEAYTVLTEHADTLPPDRAEGIMRARDFMTSFAAYYAAMDRRLTDQEEITDLFLGGNVPLLAELLATRLSAGQRAELARLIGPGDQPPAGASS